MKHCIYCRSLLPAYVKPRVCLSCHSHWLRMWRSTQVQPTVDRQLFPNVTEMQAFMAQVANDIRRK